MRSRLLALAALLAHATAATLASATETQLHGQVRVRVEAFDRSLLGDPTEIDIFQRTRVGLSAVASPEVRAFVQIQDSRAFGSESSTLSNERNVDVHQAYAELQKSWSGTSLRVRAGRQELAYGTHRILGTVGWSNVGRSFDAAQVRLQHGSWTFDLVAARLSDASSGGGPDDDLFVSYNRYALPDHDMAAELYVLHRDDERGFFETTLGEHASGSFGRLRFDHEFAYQTGNQMRETLSAFLISVQAHVRLAERGRPTLGAGFDFLTGDDPNDADVQRFDVGRIFHTGHKFYGLMDLAPGLAGAAGLMDPYVMLALSGARDLQARVTVHSFFVHEEAQFTDLVSLEPESATHLGTEVDATLAIAVAERATLEIGGALFVPGTVMENQGRTKNATWGYLQGVVAF